MRRRGILLTGVVALLAAGCGTDDDGGATATTTGSEARVSIISPANGASIKGNVVSLDLSATGIQIVKADGNESGTTGHYHVFIDKEPVGAGETIDKTAGIVHDAADPVRVMGLKKGKHRLTVVLGDGIHKRIGTAHAEIEVTVEGPTVDASAPATIAPGQPLSIDVAVEGVELLKADGDASGKTGHLHAIVDKEITPGQTIPIDDPAITHSATAPIVINGLTPGEHTIWIVVGNGNHVPLDPPVMDKLIVTVA
jgi:hypothetical protein